MFFLRIVWGDEQRCAAHGSVRAEGDIVVLPDPPDWLIALATGEARVARQQSVPAEAPQPEHQPLKLQRWVA